MQFLRSIKHNAPRVLAQLAPRTALLAACSLGGCSVAVPMSSSSALWKGPDDTTGSIRKAAPTLSRTLDAEDTRRAVAAMSTALDPQGSGASVNWDNPQSGARGSFTPVGQAYPLDGKVCRAFLADVAASDSQEKLQGAACREKSSEWALTEVKPFKKG